LPTTIQPVHIIDRHNDRPFAGQHTKTDKNPAATAL